MTNNEQHKQDSLSLSKEDLETLFESTFKQVTRNKQKQSSKTPYFEGSLEQNFSTSKKIATTPKSENSRGGKEHGRPKTSLRIKYEAEVKSIKKTCGDLETIRRSLGLSKRKMAQLLLVDPSAWTRWTSKKGEAPPHIYRALQWFLLLQEKHPEYKSTLWLNAVATPQISGHELKNIKKALLSGARGELSEKADQIIKDKMISHRALEERLSQSKKQTLALNQKLKWLLMGQFFLLIFFIALLLWS